MELPQFSWIKLVVIAAALAAVLAVVKMYGDSRYNEGVISQQTADLTASGKLLKQYQDGANKLTDAGNQLASALQQRDDALPNATATILAAIKKQPLTVINPVTGKCDLTTTFGQTWNSLNRVSQ